MLSLNDLRRADARNPQIDFASSVQGDGIAYPASASLPSTSSPISEWWFDELEGNTVYDKVGATNISLTAASTPNVEWTTKGIKASAGLVQTPSIAGVRTIAMLYKVTRGETGNFLISGGPSSGHGLLQETAYNGAGWNYHIAANGRTVTPLRAAPAGALRNMAYQLSRGGWVLVFQEFNIAYTTVLGFGGRHGLGTARCTSFEIAYAATFSGVLDDAGRADVYQRVRSIVKNRGIVIHKDDATTRRDILLLLGDSNADGRAVNSAMTAAQQAISYARTYILAGNSGTRAPSPAALLVLGTNNGAGTSTLFGPEIGLAMSNEVDMLGSTQVICKTGAGSTYVAPVGTDSVVAGTTWHPDAAPAGGSMFQRAIAGDFADAVQYLSNLGIGVGTVRAVVMLGTNDAVSVNTGATYQAAMTRFIAELRVQVGDPTMPVAMVGVRGDIGTGNATAMATIRAAQTAIAAADQYTALVDVDRITIGADTVHYDAGGMVSLGHTAWRSLKGLG